MPVDYWKTPLDFIKRNDPAEQPTPLPEPEAGPVADLLPLPEPVEPQAQRPGHIRQIGTPEQQERWRALKAQNQAKQQSEREARLEAQGGPMERFNERHSAMGGMGSYETVGRRPRGMTPMDYIGGGQQQQGPQQPQQPFGPMQFLQSKNAAIQRMEQGRQGHYRPKTFDEQMEEKELAERMRQFQERQQFVQQQHGDRMEIDRGQLDQGQQRLDMDLEHGGRRLDLTEEEMVERNIRHARGVEAQRDRQERDLRAREARQTQAETARRGNTEYVQNEIGKRAKGSDLSPEDMDWKRVTQIMSQIVAVEGSMEEPVDPEFKAEVLARWKELARQRMQSGLPVQRVGQ